MIRISIVTCTALAIISCGTDDDPQFIGSGSIAFAVGTNYVDTSVASRIDIDTLGVEQNTLAGVASTDPAVRLRGDYLFILNRFGFDNISIIDRSTNQLVEQVSTGAGSNPTDVAIYNGKAYVALQAGVGVGVIDLANPGAGIESTIDLSSLDENDGLPDCASVEVVGSTLIVACQILESFVPAGSGKIAIVDLTNNTLIDTQTLDHANPFGRFAWGDANTLLLPTVPSFVDLTEGCVEAIDVSGTPSVDGCFIDNSDLGGFAADIEVSGDDVYIAVTEGYGDDGGADGVIKRYSFVNPVAGTSITDPSMRPFDMALCPTGELVVAETVSATEKPLLVFDLGGTNLLSQGLDLGAPAVSGGVVCY